MASFNSSVEELYWKDEAIPSRFIFPIQLNSDSPVKRLRPRSIRPSAVMLAFRIQPFKPVRTKEIPLRLNEVR